MAYQSGAPAKAARFCRVTLENGTVVLYILSRDAIIPKIGMSFFFHYIAFI